MSEQAPNQIVKIMAEINVGSDPFTYAPVLTAIGGAVKAAQASIAESGGDVTKNFKFDVVMEAEKSPRQPRTPKPPPAAPASPPAPAGSSPAAATGQPAAAPAAGKA